MHSMWQLLPPTALLLLDLPKAVVLLDPQWDRVLTNDHVTLKCQGDYPLGDNSTQWWHNGTLISNQASSYFITNAKVEDSGDYKCQTSLSTRSDPVKLKVYMGWLLLQAPRWVVKEGEPIQLKCHSWKKTTVENVQYFQNGKGKKFSYQNSDFYIREAKLEHSGSYFCRGLIGSKNESSEAMNVTVQGQGSPPSSSSFFLPWHQITFILVMGLLFAVDTGLYFSVKRDLRNSKEDWRNGKVTWTQGSQGK
ncbi:low affinity immunoglobulin gamma Fc region receptor III-A isoform X4 [Physeter macrocephalus]|uniref:low affinity immunoglobulin gamma Fc region receptor III-A isoform X4 n=1 Tax=Physeter macrocephalus TaxID=9755 RepID=UPI00042C8DEF|nr:low affinity immunoglobulin gamma Fc region receptor III-A isoform X4 [Physeter catodon]|eukprot:XP_007123153.1 low affinity immunoglobulin gamma Fc region receptor III-A isoform X4 [Physeter catodon]